MSRASSGYTRRASHAEDGWYTTDGRKLDASLQGWLDAVPAVTESADARAIIAPHAGYSYSGPTAAYAYKHMLAAVAKGGIKRVFVLGPSHHVYLGGCALTGAARLATPIGDLEVDAGTVAELARTGRFESFDQRADEDEHSLEMHLPYVRKVMAVAKASFKVVPIVVGSVNGKSEGAFGALLAPYLMDPSNFFVISSDFCHWGSRFRYQHYDKAHGAIHEHIEWLDHWGMSLVEGQNPSEFRAYLRETENTICGRHPITVLMEAVKASGVAHVTRFVRYAQSSPCKKMSDSSVSYASAVVTAGTAPGADDAAGAESEGAGARGGAGGGSGRR